MKILQNTGTITDLIIASNDKHETPIAAVATAAICRELGEERPTTYKLDSHTHTHTHYIIIIIIIINYNSPPVLQCPVRLDGSSLHQHEYSYDMYLLQETIILVNTHTQY